MLFLKKKKKGEKNTAAVLFIYKFIFRISLTIVDTPGFGDNIDNEQWYKILYNRKKK
jgi:septin family protein